MSRPNVSGTNFWGGSDLHSRAGLCAPRRPRKDRGRAAYVEDESFTQELHWIGHDGSVELREQRSIGWAAMNQQSWKLTFESTLRADAAQRLPPRAARAASAVATAVSSGGFPLATT